MGFEVFLPTNYASHLGFTDEEYKSQGANIVTSESDLLKFWMADKIVNMLKDESNSTEILKKVEEEIKNLTNQKK